MEASRSGQEEEHLSTVRIQHIRHTSQGQVKEEYTTSGPVRQVQAPLDEKDEELYSSKWPFPSIMAMTDGHSFQSTGPTAKVLHRGKGTQFSSATLLLLYGMPLIFSRRYFSCSGLSLHTATLAASLLASAKDNMAK